MTAFYSIHNTRLHAPRLGTHGVECARCGMRKSWAGWAEHCAVGAEPSKSAQRTAAYKARNREAVLERDKIAKRLKRESQKSNDINARLDASDTLIQRSAS